jgi:archaellum component FlaF (FlaF/FlaG flagellin family)
MSVERAMVLNGLYWLQVQDGKQAQYDAFYRLSNTEQQITSYVFDVSRTYSQDIPWTSVENTIQLIIIPRSARDVLVVCSGKHG